MRVCGRCVCAHKRGERDAGSAIKATEKEERRGPASKRSRPTKSREVGAGQTWCWNLAGSRACTGTAVPAFFYTHREKETGTHTDTHLRPEGTRARRRRSEQRSVGRGTVDMELADDGALPLGEFGAEGSLRAALAQPEQAWFTSLVPV